MAERKAYLEQVHREGDRQRECIRIQAVFLYSSGDCKTSTVQGDERVGQPDTLGSLPVGGPDFMDYCGPYLAALQVRVRRNIATYNAQKVPRQWDTTRRQFNALMTYRGPMC